MSTNESSQVLIVGAGIAGLLAANALTRAGLECTVLEKRAWTRWGDKWCVDVDNHAFACQVLPLPPDDAIVHRGEGGVDVLSPSLSRSFNVTPFPVHLVRLWKYQRWLHKELTEAGVRFLFGADVVSIRADENSRPMVDAVVSREERSFRADLLVLASGNAFELDRALYAHFAIRRKVFNSDFLSATQEQWSIDPEQLDQARLPAAPGAVAYMMGRAGPFSTVSLRVDPENRSASILAGSITRDGYSPPSEMLSDLRKGHSFFKKKLSGGSAHIPFRRPVDLLVGRGVALIGNAGCQVYPLTGSGVALFGHAANLLAEPAAEYCRDGRRFESLWKYNLAYQQEFGGLQAAGEVFANWLRKHGESGLLERLFESGMVSGSDLIRNINNEPAFPDPLESLSKFRAFVSGGRGIPELGKMMTRYAGVYHFYRHFYPRSPDPQGLRGFGSRIEKLIRI